jgi:hypothetical protein
LDDEPIDFVFDEVETGVAAIGAELETAAKDKLKRAPRPRIALRLTWSGSSKLLSQRSRPAARNWRRS